jgi:hypothetical protein
VKNFHQGYDNVNLFYVVSRVSANSLDSNRAATATVCLLENKHANVAALLLLLITVPT